VSVTEYTRDDDVGFSGVIGFAIIKKKMCYERQGQNKAVDRICA
jgi:hypothetical protein